MFSHPDFLLNHENIKTFVYKVVQLGLDCTGEDETVAMFTSQPGPVLSVSPVRQGRLDNDCLEHQVTQRSQISKYKY